MTVQALKPGEMQIYDQTGDLVQIPYGLETGLIKDMAVGACYGVNC
jgi:hypothetical protein